MAISATGWLHNISQELFRLEAEEREAEARVAALQREEKQLREDALLAAKLKLFGLKKADAVVGKAMRESWDLERDLLRYERDMERANHAAEVKGVRDELADLRAMRVAADEACVVAGRERDEPIRERDKVQKWVDEARATVARHREFMKTMREANAALDEERITVQAT